jgi:hypothetical protein
MQTADPEFMTVIDHWKLVIRDADKAFLNLSDEELQMQIAPGRNRVYYIFGHLAAVHDRAFPLLGKGKRFHPELDVLFLESPDCSTPDLEMGDVLKDAWVEINDAVTSAIETLSPAEWLDRHSELSPLGFMTISRQNRLAVVLSLISHLSHHLGQVRLMH